MSLCDVKEFKYEDVIQHCNAIEDMEDQIKYLHCVLHEWKNNRPELDPNGGMVPNFEERIKNDIEIREKLILGEGTGRTEKDFQNINENIVKITGKYGPTDITRIFEAMKTANIISLKTEVPQIARIFFADPAKRKELESMLYARKRDTVEMDRNSNSQELVEFIKILIEKSFSKKENVLEELIRHIELLQKNS